MASGGQADEFSHIRQPAKLPIGAYLEMSRDKQQKYVLEQMDAGAQRKRVTLETGKVPADRFQSAFQELQHLIAEATLDGKDYERLHATPDQLGSVLKAARDAGKIEGTGKTGKQLWRSAANTAAVVGRLASPLGVLSRSDATMSGASRDSASKTGKARAVSIAGSRATALAHAEQDGIRARQKTQTKVRTRRDRFAIAADEARGQLRRRNSFPGVLASQYMLRDELNEVTVKAKEVEHLRKVADGAAPRDEEVELQKRVTALETQVTNQVGLIKGLREKLRSTTAERDAVIFRLQALHRSGKVDVFDVPRGVPALPAGVKFVKLTNASEDVQQSTVDAATAAALRKKVGGADGGAGDDNDDDADAGSPASRTVHRLRATVKAAGFSSAAKKHEDEDGAAASDEEDPTVQARHIAARQKQAQDEPLPAWASETLVMHLLDPAKARIEERGRAPATDAATIVFTDVQSGPHLWETMPEVMRSQIVLYRDLLRSLRQRHEGYAVDVLGDRYCFAFAGPTAACKFALDLQVALCAANWSAELCENPDTPSEPLRGSKDEFLWRGLRVSCGIHHGAVPRFDPSSHATFFTGVAIEVASLLQLAAVGGEILVSKDVAAMTEKTLAGTGTMPPAVEVCHRLARHRSGIEVHRMLHGKHTGRRHYCSRNMVEAEESAIDVLKDVRSCIPHHYIAERPTLYHGPPAGTVAMVSLAPANLAHLRANTDLHLPTLRKILTSFRNVVEPLARNNRGHVSRLYDYHYDIAFQQPYDALVFSLKVQSQLMEIDWPEELLLMPQCSAVSVKGVRIFNGLRVRAGIHVFSNAACQTDPLHGSGTFEHTKEGSTASTIATLALPGEILISSRVVDVVMRSIDRLRYPLCEPATASALPYCDGIVTLHQLFPPTLTQRATFLKREMRLSGEPGDDITEAGEVARRNLKTLQDKVAEKDRIISKLERQVREKTEVISGMRTRILDRPFTDIDVRAELNALETIVAVEPNPIMALSFAHVDVLIEQWPDELPAAIDVFDEFVNELIGNFGGVELRRAQSGAVRILLFNDLPHAVDFWLAVVRNSHHLPWPEKLQQSEHAGQMMASDYTPGIHPSLDSVVWRGLRPIGGLLHGLPDSALNPCTRTMVAAGGVVNDAVMVMRRAGEGELLIPEKLGREAEMLCEERVANATFESLSTKKAVRVFPSEMLHRHTDAAKLRAAAADGGTPEPLITRPPVRKAKALVVQVLMQRSELFEGTTMFDADIEKFRNVLRDLMGEFDARVITSTPFESLLGFEDLQKGAAFVHKLHMALVHAQWSQSLLRLPACRLRWGAGAQRNLILAGIHATIGCHVLDDVSLQVDLVEGNDVWVHRELAAAYLLARDAPIGHTVCTLGAREIVEKSPGVETFSEVVGSIRMPTDDVPMLTYAVLPHHLRDRLVYSTGDQAARDAAATCDAHERDMLIATQRAMKRAEEITRDKVAVSTMAMVEVGVQESVHQVNARAMRRTRDAFVKSVSVRNTSEDTLAILETVSMMAEDPYYLSEDQVKHVAQHKGSTPQHQDLLFHHLEHAAVSGRPTFDRAKANAMILHATMGLGDETGSDDDGRAGGGFSAGAGSFRRRQSSRPGFNRNASLRRVKSDRVSAGSVASESAPGGAGFDINRYVPVEDAVKLHVDVERFANLVLMFGINPGGAGANDGLLTQWIDPVYKDVCPDGLHADHELEQRLRDLSRQTRSLDIATDVQHGIDGDALYRSVVANLSLALQRLAIDSAGPQSPTSAQSPHDSRRSFGALSKSHSSS